MTPLWGVHWALVLAICLPLRLDAGVAFLASNVSLPFFAPFITFAEISVGARVLRGAWPSMTVEEASRLRVSDVLGALALGTLVVAAGASALGAMIAGGIAKLSYRARRTRATSGPS